MFLTAEYPPQPGGVGDYTRCLAGALVKRAHHVRVLTNAGVPQPDDGVPIVERVISNWGWRSLREVAAIVAREQPDVLHIQYQTGAYGMHPAINLLPRYLALHGLRHHTQLAVTFHDLLEPYLFPKAGPLRHWVTLRLAHDADLVVATNENDAVQLAGFGPSSSVLRHPHVIPIGSNIPIAPPPSYNRGTWRAGLGVGSEDILVGYFGLLSRSKGVDVLLDALKQLDEDGNRTWKVLLIGGEATAPQDRVYAAEVAEQIARLGLRDRIIRTGQVDEATVSAHLLAADLVALPFRDGASFRRGSLLAALAHGCAVVTTQTEDGGRRTEDGMLRTEDGRQPHLQNGENVLRIPSNDSGSLAAALQRLAHDAVLRSHLAQEARTLAAHFDWDTIARRHEEIYRMQKAEG